MTKKEYIQKLEDLIINRLKFHSPRATKEVDYSILDAIGIDGSYPIFIFNKPLNKVFYKAFYNVKKMFDFNLILTDRPLINKRKLDNLNKTYMILKEEMGSNLFYTLDTLNVNYLTHSDFTHKTSNEGLTINGKQINFDYLPYYFKKKIMLDSVVCDIKNYILNGKNYNITLSNTSNQSKKIDLEFFLPLPRGYYIFTKKTKCVEIENLTNLNKAYFNFNLKDAEFCFSSLNGIESCTFACINLKAKISLLPKENKCLHFNFGENKYCLNNPFEMNYFFELSQRKMNQLFDVKVTTRDGKFDEDFNLSLPRKIWEKWQNFDVDEESENLYLKMRSQVLKEKDNYLQISKSFRGLKEVLFFRNNQWKKVFIVHSNSDYIFADRIKYFNFTAITKEIFDKNDEIYLSFAS